MAAMPSGLIGASRCVEEMNSGDMLGTSVPAITCVRCCWTLVAITPDDGAADTATVMVELVARRVREWLRKKRSSWVPGVVGAVNVTVAAVTPVAGRVREPFRYFQS